jgi:hypothetical protein
MLPNDIAQLIESEQYVNALESIANDFGLTPLEAGAFMKATTALMRGSMSPREYLQSLSEELDVPVNDVRDLAQKVNTEVFSQVRDSLKALHKVADGPKIPGEESRGASQATTSVAPTAPSMIRSELSTAKPAEVVASTPAVSPLESALSAMKTTPSSALPPPPAATPVAAP